MNEAPITVGPETRVNTTTVSSQKYSDIVVLQDGSFVVVWQDHGTDGSVFGIFAQRFDASGAPLGGEFSINSTTQGNQSSPALTALAGGGFVVAWESFGQDGDREGIYFQRFNALGVAVGAETLANTTTADVQQNASIAALDDGGYVITWQSWLQDGDSVGVFAQRYDATGTAVGSEFQVNTYTISGQWNSSVSSDGNGGFVVAWESTASQDGDSSGIFSQHYGADGLPIGGEIQVNSTSTGGQQIPAVATSISQVTSDPGVTLVVWEELNYAGGRGGIYGQRFDQFGAVGGEFLISALPTGQQSGARVTGLADGGFMVVWQDNGADGSYYGVFAQKLDANGGKIGGSFLVNTYTHINQGLPTVAATKDGGFIISWTSWLQDGSSEGVYMQVYAPQLFGTQLGDVISDTIGANWMNGRGGDDFLYGLDGDDFIFGGAGNDLLSGDLGADHLEGGLGNDTIFGKQGNDTLFGGAGNDIIRGGAGADYIEGNQGDDLLIGGGKNDVVYGQDGNDSIRGGKGDDSLWGGVGIDRVKGNQGNDTLYGGDGNDFLMGGTGNDLLIGGAGKDSLRGEAGADTFIFNNVADSTLTLNDRIMDFEQGLDLIDLSAFGGMTFIGTNGFSGTIGEIRAFGNNGNTILKIDVDGDEVADMKIFIAGGFIIADTDFIL